MKPEELKSSIDRTAEALRETALCQDEGTLLGSEDDLVNKLGVSRVTVRQAARLLEREGVLRVKRGLNGGYFAARPSVEMVESVVCAYLNTMGLDARYSGTVTAALWTEVLREAALADRAAAAAVIEVFTRRIGAVPANASMEEISVVEQDLRSGVLKLIKGEYIELLIRINVAFSRQQVLAQLGSIELPAYRDKEWHLDFVRRWKAAKLMELQAIGDGDTIVAMMAGRHARAVWEGRRAKAIAADGEIDLALTAATRED